MVFLKLQTSYIAFIYIPGAIRFNFRPDMMLFDNDGSDEDESEDEEDEKEEQPDSKKSAQIQQTKIAPLHEEERRLEETKTRRLEKLKKRAQKSSLWREFHQQLSDKPEEIRESEFLPGIFKQFISNSLHVDKFIYFQCNNYMWIIYRESNEKLEIRL